MIDRLICWLYSHHWEFDRIILCYRRYHCNRCEEIKLETIGGSSETVKIARFNDKLIVHEEER